MMISSYAPFDSLFKASPELIKFTACMTLVALAIWFFALTHPRYFGWLYRRLKR